MRCPIQQLGSWVAAVALSLFGVTNSNPKFAEVYQLVDLCPQFRCGSEFSLGRESLALDDRMQVPPTDLKRWKAPWNSPWFFWAPATHSTPKYLKRISSKDCLGVLIVFDIGSYPAIFKSLGPSSKQHQAPPAWVMTTMAKLPPAQQQQVQELPGGGKCLIFFYITEQKGNIPSNTSPTDTFSKWCWKLEDQTCTKPWSSTWGAALEVKNMGITMAIISTRWDMGPLCRYNYGYPVKTGTAPPSRRSSAQKVL